MKKQNTCFVYWEIVKGVFFGVQVFLVDMQIHNVIIFNCTINIKLPAILKITLSCLVRISISPVMTVFLKKCLVAPKNISQHKSSNLWILNLLVVCAVCILQR